MTGGIKMGWEGGGTCGKLAKQAGTELCNVHYNLRCVKLNGSYWILTGSEGDHFLILVLGSGYLVYFFMFHLQ